MTAEQTHRGERGQFVMAAAFASSPPPVWSAACRGPRRGESRTHEHQGQRPAYRPRAHPSPMSEVPRSEEREGHSGGRRVRKHRRRPECQAGWIR
jgi:hypothetical protein